MTAMTAAPPAHKPLTALNPSQKEAAEAPEGPVIIIGGPGSGKTHTLIRRMAGLIRQGAKPATICYLTFTGRAANMARREISLLLTDEEETKKLFVGTFHAYASAYLRQAGCHRVNRTPHYTLWDKEQAAEIIAGLIEEADGEMALSQHEIAAFQAWLGRNKARHPQEPANPDRASWHHLKDLYELEKELQNTMDLDDLVPMAIRAMENDKTSRALWSNIRSRHIFVDEYQDITPSQYAMLRLMTGPTKSISIATDPNQCIYGWRGADRKLMERFSIEHPKSSVHGLRINHRNTRTLTETAYALTLSDQMEGLAPAPQTPVRPHGPQAKVLDSAGRPEDLIREIITQATRLQADGTDWEEMAIMARTNDAINTASMALRARNIPCHIAGSASAQDQRDARRLIATLTCLINPMDAGCFSAAATTGRGDGGRGLNPMTAKEVQQEAADEDLNLIQAAQNYLLTLKPGARNRINLEYIVRTWNRLNEILDENLLSLSELTARTIRDLNPPGPKYSRQAADPGSNEHIARIANLAQSSAKLEHETLRQHLTRFIENLKGANHPDLLDMETEDPFDHQAGITLTTLHKAKGLQWKAVWILDASDQVIPGRTNPANIEQMHSEQRLFYVAATRATDLLHLCNAAYGNPDEERTPTRFIDPIEDLTSYHPI